MTEDDPDSLRNLGVRLSVLYAGESREGESRRDTKSSPLEPMEGAPPPDLHQLPDDFSFSLGECVASGTVTSGTISRLCLTVRLQGAPH